MPDAIHIWPMARTVKFLGLALFLLGLAGVVIPKRRSLRLRAAYGLLVPGFVATFSGGWLLMKLSGRAFSEPWLLAGAGAGLSALHVGFIVSHRPHSRRVSAWLAWACVGAAIAWMALRVGSAWLLPVGLGGAFVGGLAARPFSNGKLELTDGDAEVALGGLVWLTRLAGASLLLVLATVLLRVQFGLGIDGGTGLFGLTHGVLLLAYLQSLVSVRRLQHWPVGTLAAGTASALLPGGSFWFEYARLRAGSTSTGDDG